MLPILILHLPLLLLLYFSTTFSINEKVNHVSFSYIKKTIEKKILIKSFLRIMSEWYIPIGSQVKQKLVLSSCLHLR